MLKITTTIKHWPLRIPFRIAGCEMLDVPVIMVRITDSNGISGQAEAAGIDYDGETPASMAEQITRVAAQFTDAITQADLLTLLPRGGARNALDCALWDLRAKQQKISVATQLNISNRALACVYTIGLGDDQELSSQLQQAEHYQQIKVKVDQHNCLPRLEKIRRALPDKILMIDANQSWTLDQLNEWQAPLLQLGVSLIEQPLPRNNDEALRTIRRLIPLAADESCTDQHSLTDLKGKYEFINIKLDKCGGLTEALAMIQLAQSLNLRLMVGNMCGSSLAMAPAFYIGQYCEVIDLDGPLLQSDDICPAMIFSEGKIHGPERELWG